MLSFFGPKTGGCEMKPCECDECVDCNKRADAETPVVLVGPGGNYVRKYHLRTDDDDEPFKWTVYLVLTMILFLAISIWWRQGQGK